MTFWWNCGSSHTHDSGSTPSGQDGIGFGDPAAQNLVGLWDFSDGAAKADTGLADGIAQNGTYIGDASYSTDALRLGGNGRFSVSGDDDPFDLDEGTIMVQFNQSSQVGSSPDTIVSRGEYADRGSEGYFNIQVTAQGAVTVYHNSGEKLSLSTDNGFFSTGDEVRVAYTWDEDGTGTFVVENVTDGTSYSEDFDSTGLSMDIGDNDNQNFTFGARESDDGSYDQYFNGHIDYVAVFNADVVNTNGDGIVEGTDGDDLIDITYTGDPDGDMIDNNDALLAGEEGDDDIVLAGAGDDTVLAGAGHDEVYGGSGDDTIKGGAGDDLLVGDGGTSVRVATGETVRESFEWDLAGVSNQGNLGEFTQDTGNVDVSFSYDTTGSTQTQFSSQTQKVHSIDTDGTGADANSAMGSVTNGQGNTGTYELGFSDAVEDVSFRINDIDQDGVVKVTAYDAAGNEINVDLTGGYKVTLIDSDGQFGVDTADSEGGSGQNTSHEYSVLVDVPGPVSRIVIEHTQDGSNNSGISVTDVYYDAPIYELVDTASTSNGDDIIDGGDGDDTIYGDSITDGDGASSGTTDSLTLKIDSKNSSANGNVLVEVTGTDGSVTVQTIVTDYGNNVGNSYTVNLNDGDTVRVGIATNGETHWSNVSSDAQTTNVTENSATLNFEDWTDNDYNDVVITASVVGDVTLPTTGGDISGVAVSGGDTITGGAGDDTIYGQGGADTITGGQGADTMSGGDDRDTFIVDSTGDGIGDVIDGGEGGDDYDTLNLTGAGPLNVVYTSSDNEDGYVEFLDGAGGSVTGTLTFSEIENVIPCFTPGTMIATPQGERDVATLKVGDKVITRDNGLQAIRWVGVKTLSAAEVMLRKDLCPVIIRQGALGNGSPERDMMVSPNHRMLVASENASIYFDNHEVLVAAKYLTQMDGVDFMTAKGVTYIHVMLDRHEVILGDGTWSESFQPGDFTLAGIGEDQREEIFSLFPELREKSGRGHYETARRVLRKHEAELLMS
ncbi:Hint domain-containing protein [Pacificibacter marinus]|uniref:Hedgehog/Intein (Hint) domain-containing protein n=1 Tax=Pacificibacter marinus TaxID=658057 RepID=A0A1Y5T0Y0_9RHOB|nr:Hint domain-containing protein [Pacificibacter marinus]SEK97755.1 Hint domain-containing protein [Pacificibacter marinus]SLN53684.1 hypothetical protein PAM7971_02740 [Pacificibacter marinus]